VIDQPEAGEGLRRYQRVKGSAGIALALAESPVDNYNGLPPTIFTQNTVDFQ
jgi:hypothetical protein